MSDQHDDQAVETPFEEFDATEAFLKHATTGPKDREDPPSEEDPEREPEERDPDEVNETSESPPPEDTEPEFDFKQGDTTSKVKLSALMASYAQSEENTARATTLTEQTARAEQSDTRATTALTRLTDDAQKAYAPYKELDWLLLSTRMEPDDFAQLRAEAQGFLTKANFFATELDGLQKSQGESQAAARHEQAKATIQELTDPAKGIKGWGPDVYNDVVSYAIASGIQENTARAIVDVHQIRMLHKAMLHDRGEARTLDVKKVVAKATVVLKPGGSTTADSGDKYKAALARQAASGGDMDSTADAFLAMARRA